MLQNAKKISIVSQEGKEIIASMLGEPEIAKKEFPVLSAMVEEASKCMPKAGIIREESEEIGIVKVDSRTNELFVYLNMGEKAIFTLVQVTVYGKKKSSGAPYQEGYSFKAFNPRTLQFIQSNRWKLPEDVQCESVDIQYTYHPVKSNMGLQVRCIKNLRIPNEMDIIQEHRLIDPVKKSGKTGEKIYVVYNRKSDQVDYYRHQDDRPFQIILPICVQIWVDKKDTPLTLVTDNPQLTYIQLFPGSHIYKNENGLSLTKIEETDEKICYELSADENWQTPISIEEMEGREFLNLDANIGFKDKNGNIHEVSIISVDKPHDTGYGRFFETLPLYIIWGCIAKGARVLLADNTEVAIEHVKCGDMIKTPDNTDVKVVDIYHGTEELMRCIKAHGEQNEVRVTLDHPLLTPDGWKPAIDLKIGDQIQTRNCGFTEIEDIYTMPYNEEVFSLECSESKGFYANNYAVGDIMIENAYETRKEEETQIPPALLEELNKIWNN